MKNTLILIILVSLYITASNFLTGCKEDTVTPSGNNDPGILRTDEFGNVLGGDTTDWCLQKSSSNVSFGPAYPNPSIGSMNLSFYVPADDTVMVYILKSSNDTAKYFEGPARMGTHTFMIKNTGEYTNTYQRVYFKSKMFISSQTCRFYGDIKFEE
ncbi:MAG: hypothetical protein EHM58_05980 [Ignavibacteriae bacterium]|nr:MAG: hypothetical protein EHM58_05980 [Ignavibacteriota bacterium]